MKRKSIIILISCLFIFGTYLFYKPMALSDLINEQDRLFIAFSEKGIKDELPYINAIDYNDITSEQISYIRTLLENYSYRRSIIHGIFSHSYSSEELEINVFENGEFTNTIIVSSSGYVYVNEKKYLMKDASCLIDTLLEIISD